MQEGLEIWTADKYPDFEIRVAVSRQAELRAKIGEEIGQVMEGIEPEDDLSE